MTVAASNDAVLMMDRHQYDTGEGPCLAAKAEGRRIYIESLAEETRWPRFVPLALGQGIMSIMSSPLMSGDRPHGALNFYSSTERAFGPKEQELAALFAKQASEIVATSGTDATARTSGERFAQALSSRRTIHQAQGIIMARDGVAADEAHQTILSGARAAGATVASYAAGVVASVGHVDRTA
jgi:GAF domain-containing protein